MDILKFLIPENIAINDALSKIDKNGYGVVYVVQKKKLIGVITDGDIRRYILKNGNLNSDIRRVINYKAVYINIEDAAISGVQSVLRKNKILSIPVVDSANQIVRIHFSDGKSAEFHEHFDIPIVIMAGGKGTRLHPYTKILPKPLIPIGDKTITEHIIDGFKEYGCATYYMIINYKKNLIKAYFQEKENNYQIKFVDEHEFLGTGGGLKLLQDKIDSTFFLTNCDVLIRTNYKDILDYHQNNRNMLTIVSVKKTLQIPYGTIHIEKNNNVTELEEKPELSFLTNTGVYIIEPQIFKVIPQNTLIHITEIIQSCIKKEMKIGTFVVNEDDWLDMGQMDELEKMKIALDIKQE